MKKILFFLIFTITTFVFFACQEKIQGCLDPNATNFDVTADEGCVKTSTSSGCPCRYPNLVLGADFKVAGKTKKGADTLYNWNGNYPLTNTANQTYFFKTMALYISDIQLIRANGEVITTIDSLVIPIKKSAVDTPNVKVRKDFTLLNSNNFNYNIGAFSQNGVFTKIKFKFGLQNPVNQVSTLNKRKIPNDNILNIDSLYLKNTFEHFTGAINYQADTSKVGKIAFFKFQKTMDMELSLPTNAVFSKGYDVRIRLLIDFSQWFSDVDFQKDTPAQIQQKVLVNIGKGWKVM